MNSKDRIKLSWDTPLHNQICLNILRPAVLRQYCGANIDGIHQISELIRRYTYGYGSGTSLNWKQRNSVNSKWSNYLTLSESYDFDSDTITIINQLDENPCSDKNIKEHAQYQHGGVNMSGEKFTAGVVYHVVNCDKSYNIGKDAMVVEYMPGVNHIVKEMIGFDYVRFHEFLQT